MSAHLAARITRLVINSTSCTATFVQDAGLAALTGPTEPLAAMRAELDARRHVLVNGLNEIPGVRCASPQGAFFAFPDITALLERDGMTARQFADRLLDHHDVACLPGTAFGSGGEGHLRLSYATDTARLTAALVSLRACAASE
jgi:aspartate/methionine/tyrosine aminotransferase